MEGNEQCLSIVWEMGGGRRRGEKEGGGGERCGGSGNEQRVEEKEGTKVFNWCKKGAEDESNVDACSLDRGCRCEAVGAKK